MLTVVISHATSPPSRLRFLLLCLLVFRLSRDSIVHAIFQSLFGKRKVRRGPRESYGGDWDDEEDEGVGGEDGQAEEVDESWIKTGISLSLFSSQALDFACRCEVGNRVCWVGLIKVPSMSSRP